jgi:hypothetical protein
MADYVTYSASISATVNSTAVTGSGTAFVTDGVRSGDIAYFIESTGPVGYVIASVESATAFTLATEYEGSTAGSKTVVVTRRYGEEAAADTYRLLNSYVQSLEDTISVSQAGIKYSYSSTTGMADPGPGLFRLNNASAASATAIAIADECGETGNPDASSFINAFDDSTSSIKGYLYVKKAGSPQTFMVYAITALSDNSGWSQLTVTYITGSGSLTNGDDVRFEFYRTGNDGFENGLKFTYSTTTTDSDPGAGIFRFNNATFASITSIYIDNADFNGVTVTTLLDSWDDSANATSKGTLRFQKVGDPTVFREFTISGAITDGTGYRKIPVTPSVSNGTWTNGNSFVVLFTRTGDDGTDGYDPGFRFAFSTTTTDSDPGAGTVRFDNANAALATYAYIDNADAAAADITAWLDGMDDSTESNHKGYLRIQKIGDPAIYREFVVTGTVVNGTGYRKVPIDLVSEAGSFSDGMGIVAHFTRTGSAGTNGTNGVDGYQSGYRLTYSTTTTAADPGAGTVRMNNLVMPSVTAIYIDNTDATGATITTWLDGLDDSDSSIRGYLRFQEATDPANYAEFAVNGAVVDSTGYRTVPVLAISSSGSWSNGDTLVATFYRSGSSGVATIADGDKGDVTVSGTGSVWTINVGAIDNSMLADTDLQDIASRWTPASTAGAASLDFLEDADNGTNKATLKGPASIGSDIVVTLPSAAGTIIGTGAETLTAALQATARTNISAPLKGHIFGLTLSNNGTDATNDIDIAAGECASTETNPVLMVLAAALTKRLDAAWAVGSGNGGLDTGSIANTTYHVWLIQRSDTGVVDALFSTSATSPTMPANYDLKRRIGSIIRASAAIVGFVQNGDLFTRKSPVRDVAATNPGTSAVTRTMSVPLGIKVRAELAVLIIGNPANTASPGSVLLSDLNTTDVAPSGTNGFTSWASVGVAAGGGLGSVLFVTTNTSGQVRSRVENSTAGTEIYIFTLGWIDTRGKDA